MDGRLDERFDELRLNFGWTLEASTGVLTGILMESLVEIDVIAELGE
ncbi:hypothetical protein JZ785_10225 [Alicyclobacillus curvatus]|nr:hypothetical protein JZ785_10225 [Alicyclobacillus curvatus]